MVTVQRAEAATVDKDTRSAQPPPLQRGRDGPWRDCTQRARNGSANIGPPQGGQALNVLVLHGSARSGGNSDTLAERVLEGLAGSIPPGVTHFRPIDMDIGHCRACGHCSDGQGCVLNDDMQGVYPRFCEADVVVVAAPMFWGYMTSQLKTLFDRLEAIATEQCFGNKDFVLLVTYRHYYGSIVEWLDRIAKGFGSRSHAVLCRTFDLSTGQDLPIAAFPDTLHEAFSLGKALQRRGR